MAAEMDEVDYKGYLATQLFASMPTIQQKRRYSYKDGAQHGTPAYFLPKQTLQMLQMLCAVQKLTA